VKTYERVRKGSATRQNEEKIKAKLLVKGSPGTQNKGGQ